MTLCLLTMLVSVFVAMVRISLMILLMVFSCAATAFAPLSQEIGDNQARCHLTQNVELHVSNNVNLPIWISRSLRLSQSHPKH